MALRIFSVIFHLFLSFVLCSCFLVLRLTSDFLIFGYHARRGELSERLWPEKGLLAFIRSTICPEANSNVKCEMSIFGDRGDL
jgi:hypothetical protein